MVTSTKATSMQREDHSADVLSPQAVPRHMRHLQTIHTIIRAAARMLHPLDHEALASPVTALSPSRIFKISQAATIHQTSTSLMMIPVGTVRIPKGRSSTNIDEAQLEWRLRSIHNHDLCTTMTTTTVDMVAVDMKAEATNPAVTNVCHGLLI